MIAKYDKISSEYSTRQYADPDAIATRQVELVSGWGTLLAPGSSVLELGAGDGFVTEHLARAGYVVHAVDISAGMMDAAAARLELAGLNATVEVADVQTYVPDREYDVVLAMMNSFFVYLDDPLPALERFARATRTKLIVDLDPRVVDRATAANALRRAGFDDIAWRPVFVPQRFAMKAPLRVSLRLAERLPGVRDLLLKRKFTVALKGE